MPTDASAAHERTTTLGIWASGLTNVPKLASAVASKICPRQLRVLVGIAW
jgi:hypothetical protein